MTKKIVLWQNYNSEYKNMTKFHYNIYFPDSIQEQLLYRIHKDNTGILIKCNSQQNKAG